MAEKIFDESKFNGQIAVILGSGLGKITSTIKDSISIQYISIPHYPQTTVEGHPGELVLGTLHDIDILIAKGRFHYYEGYSFEEITIPIQLFSRLGIKYLIITNSAGSMNLDHPPGNFMVADSHMDCTFRSDSNDPEIRSHSIFHDPSLIQLAKSSAKKLEQEVNTGTYCWTLGPMYETAEEIKYFRSLNGSTVGMSTVPEIEMGGNIGLKTLKISTLTNYAAGISKNKLSHDEVLLNAHNAKDKILSLLKNILKRI